MPQDHNLSRYRAQLKSLEREARRTSAGLLGLCAFAACYALMIAEGQIDRPGFHFYPLIAGALFYITGDLLAASWFYILLGQMRALVMRKDDLDAEMEFNLPAATHAEEGAD